MLPTPPSTPSPPQSPAERWARGSEEEGTVKAVRFSAGLLERALLHEKGDYRAAEAADYIIKFAKVGGRRGWLRERAGGWGRSSPSPQCPARRCSLNPGPAGPPSPPLPQQFGDVIEDFIEQCCLPAEKTLEELGLVGRAGCLSAAGTELCVGNLRLARDFAFEGLKMQRESEGSMALKRASGG